MHDHAGAAPLALATALVVACGPVARSGRDGGAAPTGAGAESDATGNDADTASPSCGAPGPASDQPSASCNEPGATDVHVVVTGQGAITDLRVDGTYVYWANEAGAIAKAPVCGGPVTTLTTTVGTMFSPLLALDPTSVYFTSGSSEDASTLVSRISKDGGAATVVATAFAATLADACGTLVWSNFEVGRSTVRWVSLGGATGSAQISDPPLAGGLAIDAHHVYALGELGELERVSLEGGAVATLAETDWGTNGIAVDASNVYWTSYNQETGYAADEDGPPPPTPTTSSMQRVPIAGGSITTLAVGYEFSGMALDARRGYWVDISQYTVNWVSLAGGDDEHRGEPREHRGRSGRGRQRDLLGERDGRHPSRLEAIAVALLVRRPPERVAPRSDVRCRPQGSGRRSWRRPLVARGAALIALVDAGPDECHTNRMTAAKVHRINARLSPDVARKVAYLERRTKMSTTEVVRESIDRYYAAVVDGEGSPAELLERAGFVACAQGPEDLSVSYKAALARSLGQKT